MVGQEVMGYHVEELIGRGSFASVYRVKKVNESGSYTRALKHIRIPEKAQYQKIWNAMGRNTEKTDEYFEKVFQETMQEIRLMHSLTEKGVYHVVAYYENDVKKHDSPKQYEIFILMEYLTALPDYISKNDLTVQDVLNLGIQLLDALKICHDNNIIHRDIKEDNIFLTAEGVCKLGDFGVAKVLQENGLAGSLKGTADYMAPEVYIKTGACDRTVDLYSLGIVLYRLMNHMRGPFIPAFPNSFDREDEEKALRRRMNGEPMAMPDMAPKIFGKVILKVLASRSTRYQTAEAFRDALLRVKGQLTQEELQMSVMTGQSSDKTHILYEAECDKAGEARKRKKNKRFLLGICIVGLLAVAAGGGYHYYSNYRQEILYSQWMQERVFPYECISMQMSLQNFQQYYGERLSRGSDNHYYLQLEHGYAIVIFEDDYPVSVSYQLEMEKDEWSKQVLGFYQDWELSVDGDTCIAVKGGLRVVMNYDEKEHKALLFLNKMTS